jgi:hypothetical protein
LNLLAPVRDIGIFDALYEHSPRMCVVRWHAFGFWVGDRIEWSGGGAVYEGTEDRDAFYALLVVGWCHFVLWLKLRFVDRKLETSRKIEVAEFKVCSGGGMLAGVWWSMLHAA